MKFEIRRSNNPFQPFYWRVIASNGQVLAHSETYTSVQGCLNAIQTVKTYAGGAQVLDYTKAA